MIGGEPWFGWKHDVYKNIRKRKSKPKKEIKYEGKYVEIKRLSINVFIKEGTTIEEWIENYCRTNIHMKDKLYEDFNMIK